VPNATWPTNYGVCALRGHATVALTGRFPRFQRRTTVCLRAELPDGDTLGGAGVDHAPAGSADRAAAWMAVPDWSRSSAIVARLETSPAPGRPDSAGGLFDVSYRSPGFRKDVCVKSTWWTIFPEILAPRWSGRLGGAGAGDRQTCGSNVHDPCVTDPRTVTGRVR